MRILHVDDTEMIRELVMTRLKDEPDVVDVQGVATAEQATARFHDFQPDVTLMDLELGDSEADGEDLIRDIRKDFPQARIIVLSRRYGIERVRHALEAGAQSFVPLGVEFRVLLEVIRSVHAGNPLIPPQLLTIAAAVPRDQWLTLREYQILRLMQRLRTQEEVASCLEPSIKPVSVKAYVRDIYRKTQTNNPGDAIKVALIGHGSLPKTTKPLSSLSLLLDQFFIRKRR